MEGGQGETFTDRCGSCGYLMDVTSFAPFARVVCPQCGAETRVKRDFGPYVITRRHSPGGMSMVFIAEERTLGREVALKVLNEDFCRDEKRIAALEHEARVTAALSHPNIVRVLTTGRAFGRLYIAMELVPGGHLEHRIREAGRIPEDQLLPIALDVASGLRAAHEAGLIHRDVKPGNILLDADGRGKLVDFGLALVTQGGSAKAEEFWATPHYVPPETIEGLPEDFRSDMYAFGATLYQALSGVMSCATDSMSTDVLRAAKRKVRPLSQVSPDLSERTCRLVEKLMAYEPAGRFSSYDQLIKELEGSLHAVRTGTARPVGRTGGLMQRLPRPVKVGAGVAAAVALLVGGVAGLWKRGGGNEGERDVRQVPPVAVPRQEEKAPAWEQEFGVMLRERNFGGAAQLAERVFRERDSGAEGRVPAGAAAVMARLMDGQTDAARSTAAEVVEFCGESGDEGWPLIGSILGQAVRGAPLVFPSGRQEGPDALLAAMLAGLAEWEQGRRQRAVAFFQAVRGAPLGSGSEWLVPYQEICADYVHDAELLGDPVFDGKPPDRAACSKALARLDELESAVRTRGHALRWIGKRRDELGRQLEGAAGAVVPGWKSAAASMRFDEVVAHFRSVAGAGGAGGAMLSFSEAALSFLADLEERVDRGMGGVSVLMKDKRVAVKIRRHAAGGWNVAVDGGGERRCGPGDFTVESLVALYRSSMSMPADPLELARREECIVAFDWFAGDRVRALRTAESFSKGNPAFARKWKTIAAALPK